jgi:UDP-2,4-diacetamido-2,4,6-trideoxy-beta-L-altropyranose hydrolase
MIKQSQSLMNKNIKATILADCGEHIGLGHLRRSLVLASALADMGIECAIYTPSKSGANIVQEYDFKHYAWPENLETLNNADFIIADSYRLPQDIQHIWKHHFQLLVAIDDVGENALHYDVIVNGNIYAELVNYKKSIGSKLLIGPEFSLVRPDFFEIGLARSHARMSKVLISFGGTDDGKYAYPVAKALLDLKPDLNIDVVISPLSSETPAKEVNFLKLKIHHHNPDMAQLMQQANLYVGAPGGTLIEAMAAGLPFVVAKIADNQQMVIDVLKQHNCPVIEAFDPKAIALAIEKILTKRFEPSPLVSKLSSSGAKNVAKKLIDCLLN